MCRVVLILLALCLVGCAGGRSRNVAPASTDAAAATFSVAAEDYAQAFEAARAELLRRRFDLERVDAQAGILLTRPEGGAGLLAPWSMGPGAKPLEDTLNAQRRTVEVRFEAAETATALPRGTGGVLADPGLPVPPGRASETVIVSVRVLISRRVTPNRRLDPSGIRYSLNAIEPELFRRGLGTTYEAPLDLDPAASRQIARIIERGVLFDPARGNALGRAAGQSGMAAEPNLAAP